ncbi:putative ribose-5-phosphate isomerase 4, chloroplastic [Dorcoceras hygrometricum]|uniref:Putative ribose-5-phosphate isomerase 4, chloroplastic n=1 Tax=Dorcoceras hygrometricum TaxID=472368 RepID=A0A2Z7AIL9_9LAMI|nr:putative ribose-5-phosphate isomerase 4, chloroplastic [Dorcoceras hygrometricum]
MQGDTGYFCFTYDTESSHEACTQLLRASSIEINWMDIAEETGDLFLGDAEVFFGNLDPDPTVTIRS